jgi:hypothetical protein
MRKTIALLVLAAGFGISRTGYPGSTNLMFVTSQSYNGGSFGGVEGGDGACQANAVAAGLPGTYKAWLSTDDVSAVEHLHSFNPDVAVWSRPDGALFVLTLEDLTTVGPANPPSIDELNEDLSKTPFFGVITGTRSDGSSMPGFNCGNYADPDAPFLAGDLTSTSRWTENFAVANCRSYYRIYCFGVDYGG